MHMAISSPWGKHVQSIKKIGIKLYEELRSQGTAVLKQNVTQSALLVHNK